MSNEDGLQIKDEDSTLTVEGFYHYVEVHAYDASDGESVAVCLDPIAVASLHKFLGDWLASEDRARPDAEADGYGWGTAQLIGTPPESTVAGEAHAAVYGDRQGDYGHPREDFTRAAVIWTGLLQHKLAEGEFITAEDIGRCMIGVKLARDVHAPKRDNRVDMAGYAITLDRLETGK